MDINCYWRLSDYAINLLSYLIYIYVTLLYCVFNKVFCVFVCQNTHFYSLTDYFVIFAKHEIATITYNNITPGKYAPKKLVQFLSESPLP